MERLLCTAGCGVPVDAGWAARTGRTAHPGCEARAARTALDAAVAAGGGEVRRRNTAAVRRQVIVDTARAAAGSGGSLAGVAMDLGKSEKAVERALERAGELELVSMLRPRGRARLAQVSAGAADVTRSRVTGHGYVGGGRAVGGRWLPPPTDRDLEAWRAARARRAAATRTHPPVLPEVDEDDVEGVPMPDAVLEELAAREHASAWKAARR